MTLGRHACSGAGGSRRIMQVKVASASASASCNRRLGLWRQDGQAQVVVCWLFVEMRTSGPGTDLGRESNV
jgi:hypothetical protein